MNDSQGKLVFRAVFLVMLLMVGLTLFVAGFGELQARVAGTRHGSPIPPLLGVLVGGASLGLAAILARRLWLRYALGRHGRHVAGTFTDADATDYAARLARTPPPEPTAPAAQPGMRKRFFGWYAGLVALTSGAAAATVLYVVWAPMWQAEGFIGTLVLIGAWKVIGGWALISLVTSIFASFVVGLVGGAVLTLFAVIRHALRD